MMMMIDLPKKPLSPAFMCRIHLVMCSPCQAPGQRPHVGKTAPTGLSQLSSLPISPPEESWSINGS